MYVDVCSNADSLTSWWTTLSCFKSLRERLWKKYNICRITKTWSDPRHNNRRVRVQWNSSRLHFLILAAAEFSLPSPISATHKRWVETNTSDPMTLLSNEQTLMVQTHFCLMVHYISARGVSVFGTGCWLIVCLMPLRGQQTRRRHRKQEIMSALFILGTGSTLLRVIFALCSGQTWEAWISWTDRPRWTEGQTNTLSPTVTLLSYSAVHFLPQLPFMIMCHLIMCKLDVSSLLPQRNQCPLLIWAKKERTSWISLSYANNLLCCRARPG